MEELKLCLECNVSKKPEDFRTITRPTGTKYTQKKCKKCTDSRAVELQRARYAADPVYRNKRQNRNQRLHTWRKRGIDPDLAEAYYQAHDGKCEICGEESEKTLHMDHSHETGKIRGMLCQHCNCLLGYARDSQRTLILAIDYLNKHLA